MKRYINIYTVYIILSDISPYSTSYILLKYMYIFFLIIENLEINKSKV